MVSIGGNETRYGIRASIFIKGVGKQLEFGTGYFWNHWGCLLSSRSRKDARMLPLLLLSKSAYSVLSIVKDTKEGKPAEVDW